LKGEERKLRVPDRAPSTEEGRQYHQYEITKVLNGLIGFGSPVGGRDNIDGEFVTITSPAGADTEFTVTHNLGRVPVGFFVVNIDKVGIVYDGGTVWTTTQMFLKVNAATVTLTIFVT